MTHFPTSEAVAKAIRIAQHLALLLPIATRGSGLK